MRLETVLLTVAIIGTGLVAGIFLAFSTFVMQGLARLPPQQSVAAMQAINITAITPVFMTVLFGTGLVGAYLGFGILWNGFGPGASLILLGAICYVLGVIGVTMVCNVPLNNALDRFALSQPDLAQHWQAYYGPWMWWNHVRSAAATLSALFFILALQSS